MPRKLVFDTWTPMSFKRVLGNRVQSGFSYEAPTWVGTHDRRLMAYKVLQAYLDNAAREFLATTDENKIEEHREYGDAALLRDTILAAVLGESQDIVVDGADEMSEGGEPTPEALEKQKLQDWLREQWDLERGPLKLQETERDMCGLGDGVYSLGWSEKKGRGRIRVWDPGFYFPVLTDGNEDDYPDKVHIAWEVPEEDRQDPKKLEIRRLTWELIESDREVKLPWNDEPTNILCYYTDATIQIEGAATVYNISQAKVTYATEDGEEMRDFYTGLDFVPVVHVPNTVSIKNHYGQSSLSAVLQILDDLANADTDLQAASATAGKPVMVLSGGTLGKKAPSYNAGEVWEVGEGSANWLDSSAALDALIKYVEFLLDRLSVNSRTPAALLGRVDPSEVPSGLALALSFGPLAAMIGSMRLSRQEKYPLLLKFLWRINAANGADQTPTSFFPAQLQLGSYLPADKAGAVEMVQKGLTSSPPSMSLETAVLILMTAGFPVEDAQREVELIQSRDFTGATSLKDALASDTLVAEYLGVEVPDDIVKPEPPQVVTPPDGGTAAQPPAEPAPGS